VNEQVVQRVVAEMAKVPIGQLAEDLQHKLGSLEEDLRARVIGQDQAISRVSNVIKLATTGLRDSRKPMGIFLFLGPTGVGKTELAKGLTELLFGSPSAMIRLDMSEYKEKHSVAKLIGAPPGYIGYDEEGQLTGKLRTKPHSLVLFDEIEKAHPDVFDIFLQLFDEGRLTDSKGRTIDARHSVFVMTSNAIARVQRRASHKPIGFESPHGNSVPAADDGNWERALVVKALESTFRLEFLNRIDEIVLFSDLDPQSLRAIADKTLDELVARVEERDISVEVSDGVPDLIYDRVSKSAQGARPIARLIETLIGLPLGNLLITEELSAGDAVHIGVHDGEISLSAIRAQSTSQDSNGETLR
jgi:ATP-dependent Clp protease ATP-binding subunit ClpA